jgi:hypothetical protein
MSEPLLEFIIVFAFGALFRLWLSHRVHRDAHQIPQPNDQTRCRSLRLGDRQMGLGKAAEIEILNARSPLPPPPWSVERARM